MNDVADRYRRLADNFTDIVRRVPDDRWSAQSPCDDWTAHDVVGHVVDVHAMMLKPLDRALSPAPAAAADPLAAISAAVADVQAVLDDPDAAGKEYDGFFGRTCVRDTIDRFMCMDLVIHAWDLATAAGLPYAIADDEIARIRVDAEELGDNMRAPNVVGNPVQPPPDADDQEQLLAFMGRDPRPS